MSVTRSRFGLALLAGTVAVSLAACGSGAAGPTVTVTETTTVTASAAEAITPSDTPSEPADSQSPAAGGAGTQEAPFALGQRGTIGSWIATVVSVDKDATAKVLKANQFNDKPKAGQTYILVKVAATYSGTGQGDPSFSIGASFLGSDKRLYSDSDASCVEPAALSDEPKVTTGGKVSGNLCILVPKAVVASGGLIELKDRMTFDDSASAWWLVS